MIPNLEKTIKKAISMLKPDGILAITDFYADETLKGKFFKYIFEYDGVYLTNKIHNTIINNMNCDFYTKIDEGSFPYIPFLKCNYFTGIYKLKSI